LKYRAKSNAFYAMQYTATTTLEETREFLAIKENTKDCFIDRAQRLVIVDGDASDRVLRVEIGEWISWGLGKKPSRANRGDDNHLYSHNKQDFADDYEEVT